MKQNRNSEQNIKYLIKSNLLHLDSIYNLNGSKNSAKNTLDPLAFLKNVKQFIRLLQFLRHQKKPLLYLNTNDNSFITVSLPLISSKKKKVNVFFINQNLNKFKITNKNYKLKKTSAIYLYLNSDSFTPNFFRSLFLKNFFMIYSINSNKDINSLGFYKFFINLNEIKKIFFFSVLLNKYL